MWKTWVWSLGQEYPLEKEMATHSSILAWRISLTEKPGRTSQGVLVVKNPPAVLEIWVQSLGQEYPLEKEMATHSSTLAWKIP